MIRLPLRTRGLWAAPGMSVPTMLNRGWSGPKSSSRGVGVPPNHPEVGSGGIPKDEVLTSRTTIQDIRGIVQSTAVGPRDSEGKWRPAEGCLQGW